MTTANLENSRKSSGCEVSPAPITIWLKAPLRPRNGIQAIVRMIPEVQNGIAHSRKNTVRTAALRT